LSVVFPIASAARIEGEKAVFLIHGRYHGANAWGITREKESGMFEDLGLGQFNKLLQTI